MSTTTPDIAAALTDEVLDKPRELSIVRWEGRIHCAYLNDFRIAGGKPWAGGTTEKEWNVPLREVIRAFPELQQAVGLDYLGKRVEAAAPSAWQPIETAPKDGTEVILFGLYPENDEGLPTKRVTAGFWLEPEPPIIGDCGGECRCPEYGDPVPAHWCTMHGGSSSGWMSTDGGFTTEWPPTHWMPLPSAPSQIEEGKDNG